jgi:hypothetical protein
VRWLVVLAAMLGCEGKAPEPSGIGSYKFGQTTAGSIHDGHCSPDKARDGRPIIWCMALPPFKVGKHVAEVNAYFLATPEYTEKTAPLIELQLSVRGCVEEEAVQWMRERFGPPYESKSTREYWKNSFLWAVAKVPSEPGRCLIHVLPLSENAEIERLKAE